MNPIGIYLHIPFCAKKCNYCNFFSQPSDEKTYDQYTVHMIEQIECWSSQVDRPVDTVYFGGGTPSILGASRLCRILDAIKRSFRVKNDAEITTELNPSKTDFDFAALRNGGFNRLSIGLQSSDEKELKTLGRIHSAEDAERAVNHAKASGFENISLDVMLAIPYQTPVSLEMTITFCANLDVQHISAYILKIEAGTPFERMKETLPFCSEEEQAQFYEKTVELLTRFGFDQYEISNFSRPGFKSRHNLHYWHDEEYLGIGPSAHSFLNGKRFYYPNSLKRFYQNEIIQDGSGGDEEEYLMLALRLTEGVRFADFEARFSHPLPSSFIDRAEKLASQGLIIKSEESISLTTKGFLVSNAVIAYLFDV